MDLRSQQRYQSQQRYEAPAQTQPVVSQQPATPPPTPPHTPQAQPSSRIPFNGNKKYALFGLLALLAIGVAWYVWTSSSNSLMSTVKKDNYQAVFLTNGQVYFGKIKNASATTVTMSDIYYLQQDVQGSQDNKEKDQAQNQMSLTKLGNEIHGPEDTMFIQKDQVLFWENLKTDSQVVKSIKNSAKQN